MLPTIVAMPLLGAIWLGVPDPARVQAPEPAGAPAVAVEIAAEDQGRGGRGGGQGNSGAQRPPSGPPPGPRPPSGVRPPGWYGHPYYPAPPYYYYRPWTWGASFGFGWTPFPYAPWGWIYGTAPYGWSPYSYPPYGYPPYGGTYAFMTGGVRLKVKPRDADVFVDGYYAGPVDDFDGSFQALRLAPGGHKIEVKKEGLETLTYEVHVQPDRTITVSAVMRAAP